MWVLESKINSLDICYRCLGWEGFDLNLLAKLAHSDLDQYIRVNDIRS